LTERLKRKFSHRFNGVVWNTAVLPEEELMLLEVRSHEERLVTFSAWHYATDTFRWQHIKLDEPWWVNLSAAANGVILFTVYLDTNNPDKKAILAYTSENLKLLWWNNDFSIVSVLQEKVLGVSTKMGMKEVMLDLHTGKELAEVWPEIPVKKEEPVVRPSLYSEGTSYFNTVKIFLESRLNLLPVVALEYLEYDSKIFISYYTKENDLANFLLVLSHAGELLLHEKLDESLKGIGQDTFFILSGCVIFVKNKRELISYFL
jgi:hypothetical protein